MNSPEPTPRGLLRRREAIAALGALGIGGGVALWRATRGNGQEMATGLTAGEAGRGAADQCVLTPEQTEGPYYISGEPFRRKITEGRPGVPLDVAFKVQDARTCRPLEGATVEIWHADALGAYSGFTETGTFLRGQQRTDRRGRASFKTIYPGWYTGRTVHIHVKVHVGSSTVHTGQLYFDDSLTTGSSLGRRRTTAARRATRPMRRTGSTRAAGPSRR